MSVKLLITATGHLKFHESLELYVPLGALIQVKDVLSVGCELINNNNSAVNKLGMCAANINHLQEKYYTERLFIIECNLSTQKPFISRHMFI